MAIQIGSTLYHLDNVQHYQYVCEFIPQANKDELISLYQQIETEEQQILPATDQLVVTEPSTPQQLGGTPGVELLDKIRHLKRVIEKRLDQNPRFTIDPSDKIIRQLDFSGHTSQVTPIQPMAQQQPLTILTRLQQRDPTLTELYFSGQTVKVIKEHLEHLPNNPQVTRLRLHSVTLGPKLCTSMEKYLIGHSLTTLEFDVCKASDSKRWGQMLSVLIPTLANLHTLNIFGTQYHKEGIPFLHAALCKSRITDSNFFMANTHNFAFTGQQQQEISARITKNRQSADQFMTLILQEQPLPTLVGFAQEQRVNFCQSIQPWSEHKTLPGCTLLMIAIQMDRVELVEFILGNLTAQQIHAQLMIPVTLSDLQVTIPTFQMTRYLTRHRQEIEHLLQTATGRVSATQVATVHLREQVAAAQIPKAGREQTSYEANQTPSLTITNKVLEVEKQLSGSQALLLRHLNLAKAEIFEHAARRVDLALLTFIAYYRKNTPVEINDTQKTLGKGKDNAVTTHACHSALISNFLDQSLTLQKSHATRAGNTQIVRSSILDNTHFAWVLNMTVQLPVVVNKMDQVMEGTIGAPSIYRHQYLGLINQVSRSELNPIQALARFFRLLESFFKEERAWIEQGKPLVGQTPPKARQLVMMYQKQGSFERKWRLGLTAQIDAGACSDVTPLCEEYLFSQLGFTVSEINLFYCCDAAVQQALLVRACLRRQAEVFNAPLTIPINSIENLRTLVNGPLFLENPATVLIDETMRLSAQDEVEAILIGLIKAHRPDVLASLMTCAYRSDLILDQSPLLYAAEVGNLACLQLLLSHRFDINADPTSFYSTYDDCNEPICTPLHRAVEYCHFSIAAYLLQNGANPNIFDGDFCTPLHYACNASEPSMALLLLKHGANPLAKHPEYTHALGFLLHECLGHASLSDRFIQVLANHASQLTLSSQQIYALTKEPLLRIAFAMIARIGDNIDDLVGFCKQYAEVAAKAQQYQNAITAYQIVLQLDPNNTSVCDTIATCYQELGKQRLANYRRTPSMAELISSPVTQEQAVVEAASPITDASKTKLTK